MSNGQIIVDCDLCFEINTKSREIKNMTPDKNVIMQYDHNSERFSFSMNRFVEGHDMSTCDKVKIDFINEDLQKKEQFRDAYTVEDMHIDEEDEDKVKFSWLLSGKTSKLEGFLAFAIRFICFDESAKVKYSWGTSIFSGILVAKGLNNEEVIIDENPDILEELKRLEAQLSEKPGLKTEQGGEVFNNYADNKALAPFATARGSVTRAGGKAFRIMGIRQDAATLFTFTLNTTEGLRLGDVCNVMLGSFAPECGVIIGITNMEVTVEGTIPENVLSSYQQDMHIGDPEKNVLRPVREFGDDDIGDVYVGSFSDTDGRYTRTFGIASKADGKFTTAESSYGDAGGYGTRAGYGAMSRGLNTYAKGHYSVADGDSTEASGHTSRAHGKGSFASAQFAVADGLFVKARSILQRVFGKYNVEDTKGDYAEIYGGGHLGSDGKEYPKNIRTLDWGGRGWYRGGIKIGGENQYDPKAIDVATKNDISEIDSKIDSEVRNSKNIFANALVGSVKAETVVIDDASPIEHTLEINASSKNIFKKTNYQSQYNYIVDGWSHGLLLGTDGSYSYVGINDNDIFWTLEQYIPTSKPFVISATEKLSYGYYICYYGENKEFIKRSSRISGKISDISYKDIPEGTYYIRLFLEYASGAKTPDMLLENVMIEEGTVATSYTPYIDIAGTKIKVCKGKNLSSKPEVVISKNNALGSVTQIVTSEHGTYTASCDVTKYSDDTATETALCIIAAYNKGDGTYEYQYSYSEKDLDNSERDGVTRRKTATLTTNPNLKYPLFAIGIQTSRYKNYDKEDAVGRNAKAENIVLIKEDGANAAFPVNSNGIAVGATSASPDMLIFADKAGTVVDCKYNKDANKVIEKLTNAIISLGGNV